jgi:PAS domain S-box-containing protein
LTLQNELKERALIYGAAFNQAAVGIARVNLIGYFLEVNQKICSIFEYSEFDMLKNKFESISYEEDLELSFDIFNSLLDGKEISVTTDCRFKTSDGSVFWANMSVSLVKDDDDEPKYFILVIENIEKRKQFEQELKDAKSEREALLKGRALASEVGGVCNWTLDIKTQDFHWDESMYRIYGIPANTEITYKYWCDLLHPEDLALAETSFAQSLDNLSSFNAVYRIINQSNNSIRWVKASAHIVSEEGIAVKVFGINLDITDERETQQKLEKESIAAQQSSEAKSKFLATMSHEIRTPMNGIVGMVDLLKETPLKTDQMHMVGTIRDSSFSLLEIINDILDFSKIESGKMDLNVIPTSLLSIIEKTADVLWINARAKNVNIIIEHDFHTPKHLLLDPVRVRQIILNLVGNAIKFSAQMSDLPQGIVTIRTQFLGQENLLKIEIVDNGIGMTKQQIEGLFIPFTQADSSTTRKYGGTGLGLSITKSFIDMMNGSITVTSEVAKGSCFGIALPISNDDVIDNDNSQLIFNMAIIIIDIDNPHYQSACVNITSQIDCHQLIVINGNDTFGTLPDHKEKTETYKIVLITDKLESKFIQYQKDILLLYLESNPLKNKGYLDPYTYAVGAHPLKPSEIILGISILCGLSSPVIDWDYLSNSEENSSCTPSIEEAELQGTLILVAEDQPTNRLVLGKQLEKLGYAYELADDGIIALNKWKTGRFMYLLTDCHMPNMDGFELTAEIRRLETLEHRSRTTIIAITANALFGESERCLAANMDDYISKPVELHILKKILSQYMKGKMKDRIIEEASLEAIATDTLLDLTHLKSIIGTDDREMVHAILSTFWESIIEDLNEIKHAINNEDADMLKRIAHGAKGAAASSGALSLSHLLKDLEFYHSNFINANKTLQKVELLLTQLEVRLKEMKVI